MMVWRKALAVVAFLALPAAAQTVPPPAKGSIADLSNRRWKQADGSPVTAAQWGKDKGACGMIADLTPPGAGTPEIRHIRTFFDCLRSKGYEPDMSDTPEK